MATKRADVPEIKSFKDSNEAALRRLYRECMRKAPLSRTERDVAMYLLNLWFYHKAKGVMAPGREKIATKVQCSVWTVAHTLGKLRDASVLIECGCANGGRGGATRYRMDVDALLAFGGAPLPETVEGKLVEISDYREAAAKPDFTHEPSVNFTHENEVRIYRTRAHDARAHLSNKREDRSQAESAGHDLKVQCRPQASESPSQEIETNFIAQPEPLVMALDREMLMAATADATSVQKPTPNPAHTLARASAAAAYQRSVRVQARNCKRQAAEQAQVRQAIPVTWVDYAAADDVNDPRAWA